MLNLDYYNFLLAIKEIKSSTKYVHFNRKSSVKLERKTGKVGKCNIGSTKKITATTKNVVSC